MPRVYAPTDVLPSLDLNLLYQEKAAFPLAQKMDEGLYNPPQVSSSMVELLYHIG